MSNNPCLDFRLKHATKSATILQVLARERNWAMLQIKGACGNLQHIANQFDLPYDFNAIQIDMLAKVYQMWQNKVALARIEEQQKTDLILDTKDGIKL